MKSCIGLAVAGCFPARAQAFGLRAEIERTTNIYWRARPGQVTEAEIAKAIDRVWRECTAGRSAR